MIIFRFEHNRDICANDSYNRNSESITGHGPMASCANAKRRPNFGGAGSPPRTNMMQHERCAVTAEQFMRWISPDYTCKGKTRYCSNNGEDCYDCPPVLRIRILSDWDIVAYDVDEVMEDIDWREDNDQIIFNPAFATVLGPIEAWEMEQFVGKKIAV